MQVEESTQLAGSTPQTSDASKGPPLYEVAESATKHNLDNLDRSQQDSITTTSASSSESTVKSSSHHKVSPSPSNQPSRSEPLQPASLPEESLKEKVGSHGHSPTKPVIHDLEKVIPAVTPGEDSNKVPLSENLSAISGGVQNVLFTTRDRGMKKSSKQQTSGGRSKSGSVYYFMINQ